METVKSGVVACFRAREAALLQEHAHREPNRLRDCVRRAALVETEEGREQLRAHWPVVQACKPIDEIETYLGFDSTRPDLGEPPRSAYPRRKKWYDECADHDHLAAPKEADFKAERGSARLDAQARPAPRAAERRCRTSTPSSSR